MKSNSSEIRGLERSVFWVKMLTVTMMHRLSQRLSTRTLMGFKKCTNWGKITDSDSQSYWIQLLKWHLRSGLDLLPLTLRISQIPYLMLLQIVLMFVNKFTSQLNLATLKCFTVWDVITQENPTFHWSIEWGRRFQESHWVLTLCVGSVGKQMNNLKILWLYWRQSNMI